MSRLLSFALFFTIMLTVVGGVHYYIWARLVRDLGLPAVWHRALTAAIVVLFLLIPLSFFVRRSGGAWTVPLVWVSAFWMGLILLFLVVLLAGDVGRGLVALAASFGAGRAPDPERRVALARLFGLLTVLVTGGLTAVAVRSGL